MAWRPLVRDEMLGLPVRARSPTLFDACVLDVSLVRGSEGLVSVAVSTYPRIFSSTSLPGPVPMQYGTGGGGCGQVAGPGRRSRRPS